MFTVCEQQQQQVTRPNPLVGGDKKGQQQMPKANRYSIAGNLSTWYRRGDSFCKISRHKLTGAAQVGAICCKVINDDWSDEAFKYFENV